MRPSPPPGGESTPDKRLDGWKEIAGYLNRGVRTVQRWEREYGMPVRRVAGGRVETVTAYASELDAWMTGPRGQSVDSGRLDEQDAASPPARSVTFRAKRTRAVATVLVLAGAAVLVPLAWRSLADKPLPAASRVENGRIAIVSSTGEFLWHAPLDTVLSAEQAAAARVVIDDIDGNGSPEVIVAIEGGPANGGRLYCFGSDAALRFRKNVERQARFGTDEYVGPWLLHFMTVLPDGTSPRKAIWAAFNSYDLFPTVLQEITSDGSVVGEYWSNGIVTDVVNLNSGGRARVLVGAANNEFHGGSVAILNLADPDGTAPAANAKYRCSSCSSLAPLEFFVLPPSDIELRQESTSGVRFVVSGSGGFTVESSVSAGGLGIDQVPPGKTYHRFDDSFRPVFAERQPAFRVLHDRLFQAKFLDHPFDSRDEASVWPVLRAVGGHAFEELRPEGVVRPNPASR